MVRFLGSEFWQLVGTPGDWVWCQVHVLVPLTREEVHQEGGLTLVVKLDGVEGDLPTIGSEFIETITEGFQQSGGKSRGDWIKEAVADFTKRFGDKGALGIAVIVPDSDGKRAVYVGGTGVGVRAQMWRGTSSAKLWCGGAVVSGWVEEGDVLLLATDELIDEVWMKTSGASLAERVEDARAMMGGSEVNTKQAGVVMEVGKLEMEGEVLIEPSFAEATEGQGDEVVLQKVEKKSVFPRWWKKGEGGVKLGGGKRIKITAVGVMLVLVALLVVSVGVTGWRNREKEKVQAYTQISDPMMHKLEEVKQLVEVNRTRSRVMMAELRRDYEDSASKINPDYKQKYADLGKDIEQTWKEISGENGVEEKLWQDMGIIKNGINITGMNMAGGKLLVLDGEGFSVYSVGLQDKSITAILGKTQVGEALKLGGGEKNGWVINTKGLIKIEIEGKKGVLASEAEEEIWKDVKEMAVYGSSVYLAGGKDVWKYPGVDGSLGKRKRWLVPGLEPDLSGVTAMAIDGDVWLGTNTGIVWKFRLGQKEKWSISGAEEIKGVDGIWVSERLGVLLWDKRNGRVLNVAKDNGEYKKQWQGDRFKTATAVAWDETGGRMLLGEGSNVYEVELR